jgi:tetratricopeptide (TPR) repeat protein
MIGLGVNYRIAGKSRFLVCVFLVALFHIIPSITSAQNTDEKEADEGKNRGSTYSSQANYGILPECHTGVLCVETLLASPYSNPHIINVALLRSNEVARDYFRPGCQGDEIRCDTYDRIAIDYSDNVSKKADEEWFVEGNEYYNVRKYKEAIESYSKAIEISPSCAECYNKRGGAHEKIHEDEKALADYKKACDLGLEVGCCNYKVLLEVMNR